MLTWYDSTSSNFDCSRLGEHLEFRENDMGSWFLSPVRPSLDDERHTAVGSYIMVVGAVLQLDWVPHTLLTSAKSVETVP